MKFERGQKPWNAGLKNWRVGYKHKPSTIKKLSKPQKNRKEYRSTAEERLRKSAAYFEWRNTIHKRDVVCQLCKSDHELHAHHIVTVRVDITKALDLKNGILLCKSCHAKAHNFGQARKKFTGQKAVKLD